MKKLKALSTDRVILAIKFAWTSTDGQFLCHPDELPKIIKDKDPGRGIEYIKEFDPSKLKFTKVSKEQILRWCNWDTEGTEILKNHSFFK